MEMKNLHATKRHDALSQDFVQMNFSAYYSIGQLAYISS
ncbi:Uncharacterised protein [Klebsiella variicola]|nr:Uncharacterised protein [Klebsiella variicola]SVZ79204.1 Uncharacterised protein [Klebsiella pneumoniae]DAG55733.1 MAG TPA: hypothetical protein [Caudoviricetes sp.]